MCKSIETVCENEKIFQLSFCAWSEQKHLIFKNRYFFSVFQQLFGFYAQQQNGLGSKANLKWTEGWSKGHAWRTVVKIKWIEKVFAFYCNSLFGSKPGNPLLGKLFLLFYRCDFVIAGEIWYRSWDLTQIVFGVLILKLCQSVKYIMGNLGNS